MRVKCGFWSNRRLLKEVQSYCSRHIQADSCHLLPHPPCSHARVSCLWLLFCLLTLCYRRQPWPWLAASSVEGKEQKQAHGTAAGPGSAALSRAHRYPQHGDPLHHPIHVHSQMWVQINTRLLLCGQIWRSSSWREKWMSKQKQQVNHHQPCSSCLLTGTEALLLLSAQAAPVRLSKLAHCLFQRQPTDQPPCSLNLHKATTSFSSL